MSERRYAAEVAVLLDRGSAWTKASLVGRLRDRWRLIAHAAQPTTWAADELWRSVARHASSSADPRLAGDLERLVADAPRIECHTVPQAARLALIGVSRELSAAAARRAAESAGWEVTVETTLDDGVALGERLAGLQSARVDGWLLAGGFAGHGSQRALEVAAMAAAARRPGGAPVIWAGDADLADEVADLFEEGAVIRASNPRPEASSEDIGPLREELEGLLRRSVEPERQVRLAQVSFRRAIGELARAGGLHVLGVDLGARYATRVLAAPERMAASRTFLFGEAEGSRAARARPGRVARSMATPVDEAGLGDLLNEMRFRPSAVPEGSDDLAAAQAAAQVQLAAMAEDEPVGGLDLVVGVGRVLAAAPAPWQAAQMLLDGLRPLGVTQLAVDPANLLPPLGSLPDEEIAEGMGLLADDLLGVLGTAVVCRGGEPGRLAMRVGVHRPGWPDPAPIELRVGQLQVVPLSAGQHAELLIEPSPGVSLGAPRRSPRIQAEATGGAVGLILDARDIPLALPRRADDRTAVLGGWRQTLAREAAGPMELWR